MLAFALIVVVLAYGAILLYVDDHERKRYRPHSAVVYGANLALNIVPGMFLYPIVAFCLVFPKMERYVPHFNPWFPEIMLEEIPLEERMKNAEDEYLGTHEVTTIN